MKISVSSYSYSRLPEHSDKKAIELAASQGFEGIEFAEIHPEDGASKKEWAASLAEECSKAGLEPVCYTIGGNFLTGFGGSIDDQIDALRAECDIASVLGVKKLRHDAAYGYGVADKKYKGFDTALPRIAEGCRAVTEYAGTLGIETMIENHGTFCQESSRVERVIEEVGDPNFGALIDIGNFLCADEAPEMAVGRLAPFVKHVHVKDFHFKSGNGFEPPDGFFKTRGGNFLRGAIVGHGCVPLIQCMRIIKDSGYDGFVSIEFEGIEDPAMGVLYGKNSLRKVLDRI